MAMQSGATGIPGRLVCFLHHNASFLPLFVLKQQAIGNKDYPVHVFGKKGKRRLYCQQAIVMRVFLKSYENYKQYTTAMC